MQTTSALYKSIISTPDHWYEVSVVIGESGRLITEKADVIRFGNNVAILIASSAADGGYREGRLCGLRTYQQVFGDTPTIGSAISAEIDVSLLDPAGEIPRRAMIKPYVRATDGVRYSEWLQKGVYFIDTREQTANTNDLVVMTIHGYDAMLMTEMDYPSDSQHDYPLLDITMVEHIANAIGVSVDARTYEIMTEGYMFPLPIGYSSREVLRMIAAAYGGNFVMSDVGELRLVMLNELPPETGLLVDYSGNYIVFGQDRIKVWSA